MRKYTQEEFDNFEIIDGVKQCPSGDYTEINFFVGWCSFGEGCIFGTECRFNEGCGFGNGCTFGNNCRFGEGCRFDERCSFGKWCSFGEWSSFGERCSFEGLTNSIYFAVDRIGSEKRKVYFFKADEGPFVRAGCFFGNKEEFVKQLSTRHSGTKHEQHYLKALELAELILRVE